MSLETETLTMLKNSLEQTSTGKNSPSKDQKLLRRIRKIKKSTNPDLCIAVAQWVIQHHMNSFNTSENSKQVASIMKNASSDLEHALKLLETPFNNEKQSLQALVLSADIAQKISRFDKLSPLYTQLLHKAKSNPQLNFMAMNIAPTVADWATFHSLCKSMEKDYLSYVSRMSEHSPRPSIEEALHQLAEAGMPDLGVIFSFVKQRQLHLLPPADRSRLFEQTIEARSAEVDLFRVTAETPERRKEIETLFQQERDAELNLSDVVLAVNGGLFLFAGLSRDIPQMLMGPYSQSDLLEAEGYLDLSVSDTDEDGQEKLGFDSPEFSQEVARIMPADILAAVQSGELPPNALLEAVGPRGEEFLPGLRPELRRSFEEFSRRFEALRPELMRRFGQSVVRQQERLTLRRTETGYEGTYLVRNYNPQDKSEETSIELKLRVECEHLREPAPLVEEGVEAIAAGVDGLELE